MKAVLIILEWVYCFTVNSAQLEFGLRLSKVELIQTL